LACEELGPCFIKLAQILSTRPDLVSPPYAEELAKLQKHVPELPFERMKAVFEEEIGKPCDEVFSHFEPRAIGSASIGQVYRARLRDGTRVVVKIQRPDSRAVIARDLAILKQVAHRVQTRTELGKRYDVEGFLAEFSFTLSNELDYTLEGQNADRIRLIHEGDARIFIPTIYWEISTPRVLVMDELVGTPITRLDDRGAFGRERRQELAKAAAELTFKQIFEFGFFHADPHPGNFVVLNDGAIGLMDFGMVGYLQQSEREAFLNFTYRMVQGETEGMLDALWDLGITEAYAERPALKRDFSHLLFRVRERSMEDIAASDLLRGIMSIAYRHQLEFPSNLALLFKVLAMDEGLGAAIDPNFKLFEFAEPYLKGQQERILSPKSVVRKAEEDAVDLIRLLHRLPRRAARLLQRLETGDVEFTAKHVGMENEAERIYASIGRLTIVLLLNSFIISLGLYVIAGNFVGFDHIGTQLLLLLIVLSALNIGKTLVTMWRQRRP